MTQVKFQGEKRIKVFLPIYGLDGGGAERVVTTLANNLDRTLFEPVLILLYSGGEYLSQLRSDVKVISLYRTDSSDQPEDPSAGPGEQRWTVRAYLKDGLRKRLSPETIEHYKRLKKNRLWASLREGRSRVKRTLGRFLRSMRKKRLFTYYLEDYGIWKYILRSTANLQSQFEELIEKEEPDVIISNLLLANYLALRAGPSRGIYTAVCIHNTLRDFQVREEYRKSPLEEADIILTVSHAIGDIFQKKFGAEKIRVMRNPHDIQLIQRRAKEEVDHAWFANKDFPIVVGIGRLTRQKNFSLLVEAVSALNRSGAPRVRLALFGEGPERKRLERLIRKRDQTDWIQLMGWVENPFKFLTRADVFVLSSDWEGLPNTLVEALACGVPIVSTDCKGGPREILQDGACGQLVACGDRRRLEEAISRLLQDSHEAELLVKRGLKRAWEFDISVGLQEYEDLILRGLRQRRKALSQ